MGRFTGKSPAAEFDTLLRPHIDYLYRVAYRFTGSVHEAEDLVQDVLTKLYPRTHELRDIDQLRPWLVRVLYRQFVDGVRRRTRSPVVPLAETGNGEGDGQSDPMELVASDMPGPEDNVESGIRIEHLHAALECLSREQRVVLALHDMEGYTLEEIARMLDLPVGTLKSRLHRTRRRLREMLMRELFADLERVVG